MASSLAPLPPGSGVAATLEGAASFRVRTAALSCPAAPILRPTEIVRLIKFGAMFAIVLLTLSCAAAQHAARSLSHSERELIRLACPHTIVVLGENGHGDGATIALKARLIPELVRRCGFSAIAFEGSFYDFAELGRTTPLDQPYDRHRLLSAVGRIWNRDTEFSPLADWMSQQSPSRLVLAGIDDQVGSTGAFYSLTTMPAELAALVPDDDRAACQSLLALDGWDGLDQLAQQERTDHCLAQALHQLSLRSDPEAERFRSLAEAFRRANARSSLQGDAYVAARDRAMADNLDAFRRTLPSGAKIIVWTANFHAAGGGLANGETLGQIARARYGSALFTVGFSAAGGRFRWSQAEVRDVPSAPVGSVEAEILRGRASAVAARARLASLGTVTGTALSWHQAITADWSMMFDALFVLRREEPTTLNMSE